MTTPVWQGGTLYPPGSLVQPASAPTPVNTAITNPGFESGDVNWDKGTGWTIGAVSPYQGANAAQFSFTGTSDITNAVFVAVSPGQAITCSVMVQQGASSTGQAGARVFLKWYTSADVFISESLGSQVNDGSGGAWGQSTLTATAPPTAAKVKIGARAFRNSGSNPLWVDVFTWNYTALTVPTGLVYRAVQAVTGASASVEPVWPLTLGLTVVDGDVTWEAVQATRVTWEANPIFLSGGTEPDWPLRPGEFVIDGTFQWEAINRYVSDPRSPNTYPVAILATHVFAGDDDIIKFSASTNALDWTTPRDAGYLPSGLQQSNSNEMAVLAPYRGNLAAFNASSFQLWQADPDPEAMYLLDQQDGIGSIWPRAAVAISSDLYYLAALGVRTVSQAAGNNSLNSGDVGMPVDTLIQQALTETVAAGKEPIAAYYPSLGQYLIAFPGFPVDILRLTGSLPQVTVGIAIDPYSYVATGGVSPYTFSISAGALPTGLSLNASTGEVTGTPTTTGTFSWTVQVQDQEGMTATGSDGQTVSGTVWLFGPVAQNGSSGGSEDFYLKTFSPDLLASATPTALPAQGSGALRRMSVSNGAIFMARSTLGCVSFDQGSTWSQCNIPLEIDLDVYWNGNFYFNGRNRSADGITWAANPAMPGVSANVLLGRDSDGILVSFASNTVYTSVDDAASWQVALAAGNNVGPAMTTDGSRIWFLRRTSALQSTDNLFTNVTEFGLGDFVRAFYSPEGIVYKGISNIVGRFNLDNSGYEQTLTINTGASDRNSIAYGNGLFIACAINETPNPDETTLYSSDDAGDTWAVLPGVLYGASTSSISLVAVPIP